MPTSTAPPGQLENNIIGFLLSITFYNSCVFYHYSNCFTSTRVINYNVIEAEFTRRISILFQFCEVLKSWFFPFR